MEIETLAVHSGNLPDRPCHPVTPPIILSSTFEREADGTFPGGYIYSRTSNPNREAIEQALATLENGVAGLAFSSGSAAMAAVFQSLKPGDHVIAPDDAYHGTGALLRDIFPKWGLTASIVDRTDPRNVEAALTEKTALVWMETPSNPLLKITDVARVAQIARSAGALVAVDNTFATPVLQRPLDLGADLVMHSATKYLGGHSDLLTGVLVFKNAGEKFTEIQAIQRVAGAIPSPFDCWLLQRGIRTVALRIREQSANALRVAEFLQAHPGVEIVHYPGLPSHPGHAIAARQMRGFGAMLSFQVRGGEEAATKVAAGVKIFTRATSLGGTESLIEHRASVEGPHTRTPRNLLRVSVGIENTGDLIADLQAALQG